MLIVKYYAFMNRKKWRWVWILPLFYLVGPFHLNGYQGSNNLCNDFSLIQGAGTFVSKLNSVDTNLVPLPRELAAYYKFTNLAARAIYDNNFSAASVHYDSAFIYKHYPFYEDLKKYILVNFKSGLFDKNEQALFHLIHNKKIDTAQLFTVLPKRVFDDKNLKLISKFVKERNKAKPTESVLLKSLKEIFVSDQSVRDYEKFKEKSVAIRNAIYASRDSVDAVNFIRFEKLYTQYGFPDEESVGVIFDDEHQWASVIHVLLLHFKKTREEETAKKVVAIIKAALYAGELHTSICSSLLEDNNVRPQDPTNEYYFLSTTINLVMGEVYRPFVFYTDSLIKEVNTNRIAIGLDSFHITQKQVVCQFIGAKSNDARGFISMVPYASIHDLPPGLVKMSCDEANVDYHSYKINTAKILANCRCEEKVY